MEYILSWLIGTVPGATIVPIVYMIVKKCYREAIIFAVGTILCETVVVLAYLAL